MNDYYEEDYKDFIARMKKETDELSSIHEELKKDIRESEEKLKIKNRLNKFFQ